MQKTLAVRELNCGLCANHVTREAWHYEKQHQFASKIDILLMRLEAAWVDLKPVSHHFATGFSQTLCLVRLGAGVPVPSAPVSVVFTAALATAQAHTKRLLSASVLRGMNRRAFLEVRFRCAGLHKHNVLFLLAPEPGVLSPGPRFCLTTLLLCRQNCHTSPHVFDAFLYVLQSGSALCTCLLWKGPSQTARRST